MQPTDVKRTVRNCHCLESIPSIAPDGFGQPFPCLVIRAAGLDLSGWSYDTARVHAMFQQLSTGAVLHIIDIMTKSAAVS